MTSQHFRIKIIARKPKTKAQIKRGKGQSAVACAAYRSGQRLHDQRNEKTFDFRRKGRQEVKHTEIMPPEGAPEWVTDRSKLWNAVELAERKSNAQLAREVIAGLPRELNQTENIALVKEFVDTECTSKGMIADFAIHETRASDGGTNPHVHIMLTTRSLDGDKFSRHKNRDWNDRSLATSWRNSWEEITNRHLADSGSGERVSLQSYKAQNINKQPGIHLGYEAGALEKQGTPTRRGKHNFQTKHFNQVRQAVDGLGLGNAGSQARLADTQSTLAQDRQSALPFQHQDQPLEPYRQEHAARVRQAVQDMDFEQFSDPVRLASYLQEYRTREETAAQEAANDNLTTKDKATETEDFWARSLKQRGKEPGQEREDDGLER